MIEPSDAESSTLFIGRALGAFSGTLMIPVCAWVELVERDFGLMSWFALIGLAWVAASCSKRPLRMLAVWPVTAPWGLFMLAYTHPVRWFGYATLMALVAAILIYQGSRDSRVPRAESVI